MKVVKALRFWLGSLCGAGSKEMHKNIEFSKFVLTPASQAKLWGGGDARRTTWAKSCYILPVIDTPC